MCPDFYTITACARCAAPRLRCITDFGFAYRYVLLLMMHSALYSDVCTRGEGGLWPIKRHALTLDSYSTDDRQEILTRCAHSSRWQLRLRAWPLLLGTSPPCTGPTPP